MEENGKSMYKYDIISDLSTFNICINMIINPDNVEFGIIAGERSVLGKEWSRGNGSEPYSRLYYVESGSGFLQHHGRRFDLRGGNMYLIPAHTELSFGCYGKIVISWLHFTSHLRNGAELFEVASCPYEIEPDERMFVRGIFKRIFLFLESDSPCAGFEVRACLLLLLSNFLKHSDAGVKTVSHDKFRRFVPVINYIQANVSQRVSVPKMASIMKMAPESFSRAFSKCFNTSPAEYARRRKIGMARSLLAESDRKLADIAGELGFTDAFHLSKTFRKYSGMSPSEFRKSRTEIIP